MSEPSRNAGTAAVRCGGSDRSNAKKTQKQKIMTDIEPAPKRGGRPSKFTPPTLKRILGCARRGLPLTLCAQAVGVSTQALINYRKANPKFEEALQRAISRGVDARLKKIERASENGDWRAAAWMLEHCQPQHFAKNRLEISGPDGAPLSAGVTLYLPEKRSAIVDTSEVLDAPALTERTNNGCTF
jgi:hypothetical protein